jgi:hypothetical protein
MKNAKWCAERVAAGVAPFCILHFAFPEGSKNAKCRMKNAKWCAERVAAGVAPFCILHFAFPELRISNAHASYYSP